MNKKSYVGKIFGNFPKKNLNVNNLKKVPKQMFCKYIKTFDIIILCVERENILSVEICMRVKILVKCTELFFFGENKK